MSCGRICKTTPCTYPDCATADQHAAYAEGREDAELDAARQRTQRRDGVLARVDEEYNSAYSDGYDAALIESGKPDVVAIASLCVGMFMSGVLAGWAFL